MVTNHIIYISTGQTTSEKIKRAPGATNPHRLASKCDNIHNTLVIITITDSKIFGAFTTKTWTHSGFVSDPLAFAFSINNQKIYNIIDNKNGEYAIYAHNSYGPCFGKATDFGLYSGCLGKNDNWCHCKNTYNFNGDHLNQNNIAFKVLDYEVYHIILD